MRPLLLAWACAAPAAAGFYAPGELPSTPAGLTRTWDAAQRISMQEPGFSCSSAVVSPDGYLLTNLHCILPCLEENGLKPGASKDGTFYSYTLTGEQAPRGRSCGLGLNKYRIWELDTESPEIVWLGRGRASFKDERVLDIPEADFTAMAGGVDDFAVLKYRLAAPAPCVRLSERKPAPGEPVWSVGFPSWAERGDGRRSDGAQRLASIGRVRASIRDDPVLRAILKTPGQWQREAAFFDQERLLLTDLDAMPNSSGSMMLDSSGALAALLFNSVKVSAEDYTGATVTGVASASILAEVRQGLGAERAAEIFSCPR